MCVAPVSVCCCGDWRCFCAVLEELHQDPLPHQNGRGFGVHHDLDPALLRPLAGIIRAQLAGAHHGGDSDYLARLLGLLV